ncbi:hypothetical protein BD779DRAFT_1784780 [Infundibulicybe gibba]|nr:hypothetical protein BD779DRAFT_1784780 [Infundibulicybe gibba]
MLSVVGSAKQLYSMLSPSAARAPAHLTENKVAEYTCEAITLFANDAHQGLQYPAMSIDLEWSKLDSSLSSYLVDVLNRQLANTTRPSFIGPVEVTSLDFGSVAPDVELVNLRDIYRDFLEDDEQEPVKVIAGPDDADGFEWFRGGSSVPAPPVTHPVRPLGFVQRDTCTVFARDVWSPTGKLQAMQWDLFLSSYESDSPLNAKLNAGNRAQHQHAADSARGHVLTIGIWTTRAYHRFYGNT